MYAKAPKHKKRANTSKHINVLFHLAGQTPGTGCTLPLFQSVSIRWTSSRQPCCRTPWCAYQQAWARPSLLLCSCTTSQDGFQRCCFCSVPLLRPCCTSSCLLHLNTLTVFVTLKAANTIAHELILHHSWCYQCLSCSQTVDADCILEQQHESASCCCRAKWSLWRLLSHWSISRSRLATNSWASQRQVFYHTSIEIPSSCVTKCMLQPGCVVADLPHHTALTYNRKSGCLLAP